MEIALATGTSTGIGLATAILLAKNGYRVFAGMRNLSKAGPIEKAANDLGLDLTVVEMDVTDSESTNAAFETARRAGPIDILVNNAGIGGATPLELVPEEEHRRIFETNYFGAIRCIQAVIPEMRERRAGTIINISSMEGLIAIPNQIPYSASKWALEGAGEALAHELFRFGIRILHIEPGVIMTKIYENAQEATRYDKKSPYQSLMRRNGKMFKSGFKLDLQPDSVAEVVLEAIQSQEYKFRWLVGSDAIGFHEGRRKISDEEWISMGEELSDEEYNSRFLSYFGIEL